MAENRIQITINGDPKSAIDASKAVRSEYAALNSELRTGIQQAAYGINAGTVAIQNSYINMAVVARSRMQELNESTIRDSISFNERIRQLAQENKRLEGEISNSFEEWKQAHGLGSRQIEEDNERTSSSLSTTSLYAVLRYGAIGLAAVGAAEMVVGAYNKMEEGAKRYREHAEKITMANLVTGMPIDAIQSFQVGSRAAGAESDALSTAYKNIATAQLNLTDETNKTRAALDAMNISLTDQAGKAKDAVTVLSEVADRFQSYEDGANKANLANDVLGSSQGTLIALFNRGGEGLRQYLQIADEVNAKLSAEELQKQQTITDSERIIQEARSAAIQHADQSFAQIRQGLLTNIDDWEKYKSQFGSVAEGIANLWHAAVERIKVDLRMIPQITALGAIQAQSAAKSSMLSEYVTTGNLPDVSQMGPTKTPAPGIISISELDKNLTDIKNRKENVLTWEAAKTQQYWKDSYVWAANYYGKQSALAQQAWAKYADATRAAQTSDQGSGADPWSLEQLREKIHQIQADFLTMYREFHNAQYSFWQSEAESQGRFSDAAILKNWQVYENTVANIVQQTEKAKVDIQSLKDKMASDRGLNPEAAAAAEKEIARLKGDAGLQDQRIDQAKQLRDLTNQLDQRKQATEIAQINVTYAQLTGTMREQFAAQIDLINAQAKQNGIDDLTIPKTDAKAEALRRLHLEQQRLPLLNMDGSFFQGLSEGWAQLQREMQTTAQMGVNAMKDTYRGFVNDVGSGLKSLFSDIFTGQIKSAEDAFKRFCDVISKAFSNAISNMLSKWIESQLTSLMTGGGSGGGGGLLNFFGLFGSSGGGSGSGSGDIWGGALSFPGFAGGGDPPVDRYVMVGENGPEIARFRSPATIYPSGTAPQTAAPSGPPKVNITVNDYSGKVTAREEDVSYNFYEGVLNVVVSAAQNDPRYHDSVKRANRM